MQKAQLDLNNAQAFLQGRSHDRRAAETKAREAAQMAEDARIITRRKVCREQLDAERAVISGNAPRPKPISAPPDQAASSRPSRFARCRSPCHQSRAGA
jgi:hypothetical protein